MSEAVPVKEYELTEPRFRPTLAKLADHARAMVDALRPLEAVTEQFLVPDDCLPAGCDQALAALQALIAPADRMLQLLKQKGQYPPALAVNRFDLLASLRFIETRSAEAQSEIGCFRLVCQEWNPQTTHQRLAIRRRLEMLVEAGSEVSDKVLRLPETLPVPSRPSARTNTRTI